MATTTLGNKSTGSIIKLKENGTLVDFYVAKHDYESGLNGAGRTLVVRKDTYDDRVWDNGNVNAYASSDLDSWFNSTYKNMLDADIRSLIGTTKIRYTPGNGNNTVGTLERAIFALSLTELGQSHTYANTEGSALPIASTLRIAYRNGSPTTQWTRSPNTNDTYSAWWLYSSGNINYYGCRSSYGSRPAFTLPSSLYVSDDGSVFQNTAPSAPSSITVPTVIAGKQCTITWTASTDPDGTITAYILERNVNGSGWTQVFSGNAMTYTDTIGSDWGTVAYRVCAVDNLGLSSEWTTSESLPVRIPGTPSLTFSFSSQKVSAVPGFDYIIVAFQSDIPYQAFECRATKVGEDYGVGKGALVASFSTTPANTQRQFEVYDDYLVHGDGEYRISLFAQGQDGSWNDNHYYIPVGSSMYVCSDGEPYLCMRGD